MLRVWYIIRIWSWLNDSSRLRRRRNGRLMLLLKWPEEKEESMGMVREVMLMEIWRKARLELQERLQQDEEGGPRGGW